MLTTSLRRVAVPALVLFVVGCGTSSSSVAPADSSPRVVSDAASGTGGFSGAAGGDSRSGTSGSAEGDAGATPDDAASACHPVAEAHPIEGFNHTALCDAVTYLTNPPSSGNHYPYWAAYQTYTAPIRAGFWVHNLEHGAVVIGYNCPEGCDAEVAEAQAFIDSLPADCVPAPPPRRLILLPNPALDVRFAASAWGYTLKANCFDRPAFAQFVADHYGQGREAICSDGLDPTGGPGGVPVCPN